MVDRAWVDESRRIERSCSMCSPPTIVIKLRKQFWRKFARICRTSITARASKCTLQIFMWRKITVKVIDLTWRIGSMDRWRLSVAIILRLTVWLKLQVSWKFRDNELNKCVVTTLLPSHRTFNRLVRYSNTFPQLVSRRSTSAAHNRKSRLCKRKSSGRQLRQAATGEVVYIGRDIAAVVLSIKVNQGWKGERFEYWRGIEFIVGEFGSSICERAERLLSHDSCRAGNQQYCVDESRAL